MTQEEHDQSIFAEYLTLMEAPEFNIGVMAIAILGVMSDQLLRIEALLRTIEENQP